MIRNSKFGCDDSREYYYLTQVGYVHKDGKIILAEYVEIGLRYQHMHAHQAIVEDPARLCVSASSFSSSMHFEGNGANIDAA